MNEKLTVKEAQHQIGKILERLEKDNGALVKGIELYVIDVSSVDDPFSACCRVEITMDRVPGRSWS